MQRTSSLKFKAPPTSSQAALQIISNSRPRGHKVTKPIKTTPAVVRRCCWVHIEESAWEHPLRYPLDINSDDNSCGCEGESMEAATHGELLTFHHGNSQCPD